MNLEHHSWHLVQKGNNVQTSSQLYGEWDNYSTWLIPHNVFHFKLATGYQFSK